MNTIQQSHEILKHFQNNPEYKTSIAPLLELFHIPLDSPKLLAEFKIHSAHCSYVPLQKICSWFVCWLEASALENADLTLVYLINEELDTLASYIDDMHWQEIP